MVSSEMTDIGINTFYLIFYDCKYNNEKSIQCQFRHFLLVSFKCYPEVKMTTHEVTTYLTCTLPMKIQKQHFIQQLE